MISLITAVASVATLVIGMINTALARKNEQHIADAKLAIQTLEKNTNSIKDELVRVTGESEHARGLKQGQEEGKKE